MAKGLAERSFLSCLCGSELGEIGLELGFNFLSCLCGSERGLGCRLLGRKFLSCLCGSELFGVAG